MVYGPSPAHVRQRMKDGVSNVWVMQSDWRTDPSLPEKLKNSQLYEAGNGADRTDWPTMHFREHPMQNQ